MLENVARDEVKLDEKLPDLPRVTCFVCKQEVEKKQAQLVDHPREKQVWVCKAHIK